MKYFIKTAKDKELGDYAASAALGSVAGMGATTAYHVGSAKLQDPYYSTMLSDVAKKQFHSASKGKTKFFKSLVHMGGAGAVAGVAAAALIKKERKEDGEPTKFKAPTKILGAAATAALGVGAYKHRGKLYLMQKGHLDKFDPWRGQTGMKQFFKGEQWVDAKSYDDLVKKKTAVNNVQDYSLAKEFPGAKGLKAAPGSAQTGGKSLDDFYAKFEKDNKLPVIGGDPEFNITLRMGKKKLPLDIAGYASEKSTGGAIRDFSVGGAEFSNIKPGTADEFSSRIKRLTSDFEKSIGDKRIKIEPVSVAPLKDSKYEFATSRRTAGGHIHASFPKTQGEDLDKTRVRMQKRVALLHTPLDYTNPAGPARFGLERGGGTYGKQTVGERASREVSSWKPDKGYGNMEVRHGPSYVKDIEGLTAKTKLMQVALNHPDSAKLDAIADKVFKVTNNDAAGLYNKDVRKYLSSELRSYYKGIGINDNFVNETLGQYEKGKLRALKG